MLKKTVALLTAVIAIMLMSCAQNAKTSDSGKGDASAFRYLGVMYNEETGKEINDEVLTGEIYAQNPERIQKAMNIMLRFPLDLKPEDAQGPGAAEGARSVIPGHRYDLIEDVSDPANWFNEEWWKSLPEEVDKYVKATGKEIVADGISEGLRDFITSDEFNNTMSNYLIRIDLQLRGLIKFGLHSIHDEFKPEIMGAFSMGGVMLGTNMLNPMGGLFGGDMLMGGANLVMQGVSMGQNAAEFKKINGKLDNISNQLFIIMAQIAEVQESLARIEEKLDEISAKIDKIEDITIRDLFQNTYRDVADARNKIEAIYSHLNSLKNKNDREEYLYDLFVKTDQYDVAFTSAMEASQKTHALLKEYNLIRNVAVEGVSVNRWNYNTTSCSVMEAAAWKEFAIGNLGGAAFWVAAANECKANPPKDALPAYTYTMKEPAFYCSMSMEDMSLMRRMSLERLSLLGQTTWGIDLLEQRGEFAKEDLKKLLKIKEELNAGYLAMLDYVRTQELNPSASVSTLIDTVRNVTVNTPQSQDLRDSLLFFTENNAEYKDYFIAAFSMIAEWEIKLRAHIIASEVSPF